MAEVLHPGDSGDPPRADYRVMARAKQAGTPPTDLDSFARATGIGGAGAAGRARGNGPGRAPRGGRPQRSSLVKRLARHVALAVLIAVGGWAIHGFTSGDDQVKQSLADAARDAAAVRADAQRTSRALDGLRVATEFSSKAMLAELHRLRATMGSADAVRALSVDANGRLSALTDSGGALRMHLTRPARSRPATPLERASVRGSKRFPLSGADPGAPARILDVIVDEGAHTSRTMQSLTLASDPTEPGRRRWTARWASEPSRAYIADQRGQLVRVIRVAPPR